MADRENDMIVHASHPSFFYRNHPIVGSRKTGGDHAAHPDTAVPGDHAETEIARNTFSRVREPRGHAFAEQEATSRELLDTTAGVAVCKGCTNQHDAPSSFRRE
jgi:hypothetical protein